MTDQRIVHPDTREFQAENSYNTDPTSKNSVKDSPVQPKVVSLFDELGKEHEYLPYDPDRVCKAVVNESDTPENAVTADEIAELTKKATGIAFPDLVITRADIRLQDEYLTSDISVLLHLMQAHGELIREGKVSVAGVLPRKSHHTETELNRTFIMVCTLQMRTERAMTHLGSAVKSMITKSKDHAKSLFNWNQQ